MIIFASIMYSQVKFNYQVVRNTKLMEEVYELKQETLHMKETPKRLYESVANCKDVYKGVIVTMKVNSLLYLVWFLLFEIINKKIFELKLFLLHYVRA